MRAGEAKKEVVLAIRVEPSLLADIDAAAERLTKEATVEFSPGWTRANTIRFLIKRAATDLLDGAPLKTAPRKGKKAK